MTTKISNANLDNDSIVTGNITDGTIVNADVSPSAAIASSKDNPRAIPTGAAASAVAPDITKPCKNSAVSSLVCMKGILSVNGPHFIPFLFILFPL